MLEESFTIWVFSLHKTLLLI